MLGLGLLLRSDRLLLCIEGLHVGEYLDDLRRLDVCVDPLVPLVTLDDLLEACVHAILLTVEHSALDTGCGDHLRVVVQAQWQLERIVAVN